MYQGKHSRQSVLEQRCRLARKRRKATAAFASLALVGVLAVGGTIAWLTDNDTVENTFQSSEVTCKVDETFDGKKKSGVRVANTGDVTAYIRAEVVANWVKVETDDAGNKTVVDVYGEAPVVGEDYSLDIASDTGWIPGGDGYYYYKYPVSANAEEKSLTGILINSCAPLKDRADGYTLSVDVLCGAIQAESGAVNSWDNNLVDIGVDVTGVLTVTDKA